MLQVKVEIVLKKRMHAHPIGIELGAGVPVSAFPRVKALFPIEFFGIGQHLKDIDRP
jgi:hypothetical protein